MGRAHPDSASFTISDDLNDRNGHGTHIAGIIGGTGAASNGYLRGIAPECDLIVLKIAGKTGRALEWNTERALDYAIEIGVDVINYSNGTYPAGIGDPPWLWSAKLNTLEEYFTIAEARGIVCIAAAGNAGPNGGSISRPAGLECVLTVGALNRSGAVRELSSRGPYRRSPDVPDNQVVRYDRGSATNVQVIAKPNLAAPGEVTAPRSRVSEFSEDPEVDDPNYILIGGSSQAAAVTSGLTALAVQELRQNGADLGSNPSRSVRRLLCHAAMKLDENGSENVGQGMVIWPTLIGIIQEFVTNPSFRETVIVDAPARLWTENREAN